MSSPPTKYLRYFDFTTYATNNPEKPLPGASVDQEFNRIQQTTSQTIDRLAIIQRDDGKLQDGAITTSSLLDGSVTNPKLAPNAVTHDKIAPGEVQNANLGPASVDNSKLGPLSVATANLQDASVTGPKLAAGSVGGGALAPGSITTVQIQDGGVATVDLADGAVTNPKLAPLSVDNSKLALLSVAAANLQDGAVTLAKHGPLSVDNSKLALLAVATGNLQDASVTGPKLAPGSVDGTKLAPGAVGPAAIPDGSITSAKILDGGLATVDYADASITNAKLAPGSVDSSKILDGTIAPADLSAATLSLITSTGNPRGAWATGVNYAAKDSVTQGSGIYICTVAHLSGVFATDLAAGKWALNGQAFDQSLNTTDDVQFATVKLGGVTNAFPMIINSGAELHAKTADNLSFATTRAQNFVAQGSQFYGGNGTSLLTPADGIWRLLNAAGTDFSFLQFGGGSNAFPSLKRSGTSLLVKLADDSATAPFGAASVTVYGNVAPANGMFLSGANQIGWSVNSGTVMTLDGGLFHCAPNAQFDGNVAVAGTVKGSTLAKPTRTIFGAGAAGNYNPPAGCRQLRVRMCGGGGGSGGWNDGTDGTSGGITSFAGATAGQGTLGHGTTNGSSGGSSAVGVNGALGQNFIRVSGGDGEDGWVNSMGDAKGMWSQGGSSGLGFGVGGNHSGRAATGYGAGGAGALGYGNGTLGAGAGGGAEGVEFIINNPVGPLAYSVGNGGAAAGSGSILGKPGTGGILIIDEFY